MSGYHAWVMKCRADIQEKIDIGDNSPYIAEKYEFPAELKTYSRMCKMVGKDRVEYQYPYMLFDLTTDSNFWKNASVKNYMNAHFEIIGWSEPKD